ncbi:MAG: imidazole glycerol phosphate synthase, glutamine amidotransferase subunit [Oscillospiraceae bacterium]|nr:imidazole glycerol phosphate synthase, glutamine amidotransferase subunit [Oscillospiraceae bacterium]
MIAIVDYGAGNLFSVKNACDFLSLETVATSEATMLEAADGIILPGVGAFPDAMKMLHATGLLPIIKAQAKKKPLLGICLGMQILFDYGTEFERCDGLGLIPGYVDLLPCKELKLPQIGWNSLTMHQPSPILADTQEGDYVYFVHSFGAVCDAQYILASTEYGCKIPALVRNKNVFGAQFHPEKSGEVGLNMLKNFGKLVAK